MVKITGVGQGSLAAGAGLRAADILISINGNEIYDVLDYRFYLSDENLEILYERDGKQISKAISKDEYEDIGLEFETPLMDKKRACRNKCIFCFIDQLPRGMRETLYFKDDDSRLSFLHGNYITLTNLTDADVDRIIKMRFSPINISVHTTNPSLRRKMMNNKRAGEVLSYIGKFAEAGLALRCQIVLCRGINDGDELLRTMHDLAHFYPALESVSVVPAGITDYREGLYPLEPYTARECADIINMVESFAAACKKAFGTSLFYCADELYIKSGRTIPDDAYYEEYTQIENGIGLLSSLSSEFDAELEFIDDYLERYRQKHGDSKRHVSIATGEAAFDFICALVEKLRQRCYNIECTVYKIANSFFGKQITVAGLLTGKDIVEQLKGKPLGDELLLPAASLRSDRDVFLCGMTPDGLTAAIGVPVRIVEQGGAQFISAILGIDVPEI